MRFSCPYCQTQYRIAREKLANRVLRIKCKVCENALAVRDPNLLSAAAVSPAKTSSVGEDTSTAAQSGAAASNGSAEAPQKHYDPDAHWYYAHGQRQLGPFSVDTLERRIEDGTITNRTYVWYPEMSQWEHAGEVQQFESAFAPKEGRGRPPLGARIRRGAELSNVKEAPVTDDEWPEASFGRPQPNTEILDEEEAQRLRSFLSTDAAAPSSEGGLSAASGGTSTMGDEHETDSPESAEGAASGATITADPSAADRVVDGASAGPLATKPTPLSLSEDQDFEVVADASVPPLPPPEALKNPVEVDASAPSAASPALSGADNQAKEPSGPRPLEEPEPIVKSEAEKGFFEISDAPKPDAGPVGGAEQPGSAEGSSKSRTPIFVGMAIAAGALLVLGLLIPMALPDAEAVKSAELKPASDDVEVTYAPRPELHRPLYEVEEDAVEGAKGAEVAAAEVVAPPSNDDELPALAMDPALGPEGDIAAEPDNAVAPATAAAKAVGSRKKTRSVGRTSPKAPERKLTAAERAALAANMGQVRIEPIRPTPAAAAAAPAASLDAKGIAKVFKRRSREVSRCAQRGGFGGGKVKVGFTVGVDGRPRSATIQSVGKSIPMEMRSCIEELIGKLHFPQPDEAVPYSQTFILN